MTILTSTKVFGGVDLDVKFIPISKSKSYIKLLANYINEVLGEYNYYTSLNHCFVTLSKALNEKYIYVKNGKYRQLTSDALLEWVYWQFPELDDDMSLPEVEAKRDELLESTDLYHFYKLDVVNVNVFRRMTRSNNSPKQFLAKNIRGLSKRKNGHLRGDEEVTRKHLYDTYSALLNLWENGLVPVITVPEQDLSFPTEKSESEQA